MLSQASNHKVFQELLADMMIKIMLMILISHVLKICFLDKILLSQPVQKLQLALLHFATQFLLIIHAQILILKIVNIAFFIKGYILNQTFQQVSLDKKLINI